MKDMVYALNIVDGPSSPDVMFVENTQLGLQEDEDSIGKQWRNELTDREFATLAHQASSDKYGGPEERQRHYEINVRKHCGLGTLRYAYSPNNAGVLMIC